MNDNSVADKAADVKQRMYRLRDAGLSVVAVDHETKKPLGSWKQFQSRLATDQELAGWGAPWSYALVGGAVSGGLEYLDFDHNEEAGYDAADFFALWWEECGELAEQYRVPVWRTGGNGYGLAYRVEGGEAPGNQKLAWVPDASQKHGRSIAIETRGEGGYFVGPGSLHPSGNFYVQLMGVPLTEVPTVPRVVRDKFILAARRLCLMPYTPQEINQAKQAKSQQRRQTTSNGHMDDVIETFNATHTMRSYCLDLGWTVGKGGRLSRPGKPDSNGLAILDEDNVAFAWSSNDPLHRTNGAGLPLPMDPFDVYTIMKHDGDFKAAYVQAKKDQGKWTEAKAKTTIDPDTGQAAVINPTPIVDVDTEPPPEASPAPGAVKIGSLVMEVGEETEDDTIEPSPLATEVTVDGLDLGWIDAYIALAVDMIDSPPEFNRLCALVAGATAIRGNAWLPMSFDDIYPNIYGVGVAPSSSYSKSATLRQLPIMLQRAQLGELLLANQMTPEGLLRQLQNKPAGLITADEVARILGSHNIRYLQDLKPALTDIFDCRRTARRLSHEEIVVERPYLSIMGMTTPARFYDAVGYMDWEDGFLARWLFAVPETEPDFDRIAGLRTAAQDNELNRLAHKLFEISQRPPTAFKFKGNAHQIWGDWQSQSRRDAYHYGDEVAAAFVKRYATYALKFAIILAALNGEWGVVTPGEMTAGIMLADHYKDVVNRLMSERQNYGISGSKLQKIHLLIWAIVKKGGKATGKKIMQRANMRKSQVDPVLQKLVEIGAVIQEPSGRGFHYIPVVEELPAKSWK